MAQEIMVAGAIYEDVPSVRLPDSNGVFHPFTDTSDTTAVAADVAEGKLFHLADGAPYLVLELDASGALLGERRTVDLDAWRRVLRPDHEVAPPPETPYEPSTADASLPVQLFADPDATFASLTNAVLRLRAAGFENLFVANLEH